MVFSTLTTERLTGLAGWTAFHLKLVSGSSPVMSITIGASSRKEKRPQVNRYVHAKNWHTVTKIF